MLTKKEQMMTSNITVTIGSGVSIRIVTYRYETKLHFTERTQIGHCRPIVNTVKAEPAHKANTKSSVYHTTFLQFTWLA